MVLPTFGGKGKAARAMKGMKAKCAPKVATGRYAKAMVIAGSRERTVGGIRAEGLMRNKRGRIVSKRRNAHGKRMYRNVESWIEAVLAARAALHCKGLVVINGRTLLGKALYAKAKAIFQARRPSASAGSTAPGH